MIKIIVKSTILFCFFFSSSALCETAARSCHGKLGRNQPVTQFNGTSLDFKNLLIPANEYRVSFFLNTPSWKTRHNIKQLECTVEVGVRSPAGGDSAVRIGKQLVSDVQLNSGNKIIFNLANIETGDTRGTLYCYPIKNDPTRDITNFKMSEVKADSLMTIFAQGSISCSVQNIEHLQQMKMPVEPQNNNTNQPVEI